MKKNNAFTLIELLVVVLIISILAGVALSTINSQGIRGKARDSQRIADLKRIQAALELYFVDNRQYPVTALEIDEYGSIAITGSDELTTALALYLNTMPQDPLFDSANAPNTPCQDPEIYRYNYMSLNNGEPEIPAGSEYVLTAMMEIATSNDTTVCHDLNNWVQYQYHVCEDVEETKDVCYGVENP